VTHQRHAVTIAIGLAVVALGHGCYVRQTMLPVESLFCLFWVGLMIVIVTWP
jgi:hypothetical protein